MDSPQILSNTVWPRINQEGSPGPRRPFLCQLDEAWVLYYPLTDKLLMLNSTAKAVWDLLADGHGAGEISSAFVRDFGISGERADRDVAQVLADLADEPAGNGETGDKSDVATVRPGTQNGGDRGRPKDCGVFDFGGSRVRVLSAVTELDDAFFLRFQHRASGDGHNADVLEISLGDADSAAYRVTFCGDVISPTTTIVQTMSRVVELMLSLEHPHRPSLAYFHAAAVSYGERSLLMPGSSGMGKSTLTGFLAAHGFAYLSDDLIAIGEDEMAVLPLPTCLSIKAGSWAVLEPFYPVLSKRATLSRYGRSIRYIEPRGSYELLQAAAAPAAIVFPAYQAGAPTRLTPLRPLQTMVQLLEANARLAEPLTQDKLAKFIRFVEQTPAYELRYSELPGAMEAIEDLLAN